VYHLNVDKTAAPTINIVTLLQLTITGQDH